MAWPTPRARLTYEDLRHFPDDGKRHELIGGEHYVTPSPALKHQAIVRNLVGRLAAFLLEKDLGRVYPAPCDVVLTDLDVVLPDLLYVSHTRSHLLTERHVRGAPDLVVEILSPSTRERDLELKRELYEKHGFCEYWIVDPEAETVQVLRSEGSGRFTETGNLAEGSEALTTPLLPGLRISLSELFRD